VHEGQRNERKAQAIDQPVFCIFPVAPLEIRFCCILVFFFWERRARSPLLPLYLLKNRGVWAGFEIAGTLNFAL
jgi:hypothetical protein